MRYLPPSLAAVSVAALALACSRGTRSPAPLPVTVARADLRSPSGTPVGTATLREAQGGVLVSLDVSGLPAGTHGIHFHAVGRCDDSTFASAGPHYNPRGHAHGLLSPTGAHAGDLPNITVAGGGTAHAELLAPGVALSGGSAPLLDADGSALVIHAGADDYVTDPSGNSGARVACGVVTR